MLVCLSAGSSASSPAAPTPDDDPRRASPSPSPWPSPRPPRTAGLAHLQRRPPRAEVLAPHPDHPRERRPSSRSPGSMHTGDVSDGVHRPTRMHGAGRTATPPPTVWSATPLFVNDTVYVGTPFYRIFALEPDTGAVKWTYDSHAVLEALTQPDLKNRGVAYWAAAEPRRRPALPEARLHRHHGREAPCRRCRHRPALRRLRQGRRARHQRLQHRRTPSWPLSLLQPPTVFKDTLFLGWAGKDWAEAVDCPGSVFALDARTGAVRWTFETLPPEVRGKDRHRQRLGLHVGRSRAAPAVHPGLLAQPQLLRRRLARRPPRRHLGDGARRRHRRDGLEPTARPPRPLGPRHQLRARRSSTSRRTAGPSRRWCRPRSRASSTSSTATTGEPVYPDRGAPGPADSTSRARLASPTQPYVRRPERVVPDRWPGVFRLADFVSRRLVHAATPRRPARRRLASRRRASKGTPRLSRHHRRHRMGRRRGRPRRAASSSSTTRARCRSTA